MYSKAIEKPTIAQILALERKIRGERLELFQSAFDALHDNKQDDFEIVWKVDNLPYLYHGFKRVNRESRSNHTRPAGVLHARIVNGTGEVLNLGLVSVNIVTDVGVAYIIDALQNLTEAENFKYHASGTTNTAENVNQTALIAEVGTRVVGTQVEGASANIYKTIATLTYGSSFSIVEHGLFSASSAGTLFDRSIFTAIPVDTSTGIEFTYQWTLNSGG